MSRWRKIGVLLSALWMIGLPIYVMADSNRRASEFYAWCRSLESNSVSDITSEQQHEVCWRSAKFMTPSVLAQTLIAGTADTATMWTFILGPVVILWIVGGIILATVRWVRRGFLRGSDNPFSSKHFAVL
jgi:beta-lactamase regulating signal transducer with metallopeptidase domain